LLYYIDLGATIGRLQQIFVEKNGVGQIPAKPKMEMFELADITFLFLYTFYEI